MAKRPMTVREMKTAKKQQEKVGTITVSNISNQAYKIHLKPPIINGKKVDFYVGAQDINMIPGRTHSFKKDRLWMQQIDRLKKQRLLSIISDSDLNKKEEA